MSINLGDWVVQWDRDFEGALPAPIDPQARRPFSRVLEALNEVQHLRFQPYQNDTLPNFVEKLKRWLVQFPEADRRTAFLLANRVVFVTARQFDYLQVRLLNTCIRKAMLELVIARERLGALDYARAMQSFDMEMNATLFVGLSDSSQINAFTHLNSDAFADRERRSLVGPDLRFWVYPSQMATSVRLKHDAREIASRFEADVLGNDRRLQGKRRLVLVEDFSGTGADLAEGLAKIARSQLPFAEVIVAPVVMTAKAAFRLTRQCRELSRSSARHYKLVSAMVLPHSMRCFDGPDGSYLDGPAPWDGLADRVRELSSGVFKSRFASAGLDLSHQHGFGGMALAFVMHTNCPDNSLPILWKGVDQVWAPLFPRASRYI